MIEQAKGVWLSKQATLGWASKQRKVGRLGDKKGEMGSFRPFSEVFSFYFERKRGQNGEDGFNVG